MLFDEEKVVLSKPRSLRRLIGRTWLKAFGWKVDGSAPEVAKAVIIAAPHTSGWDLPFTLAVAYDLGIELNFVAKQELFKGAFGPLVRWLGGIAVNRSAKAGFTSAVAKTLRESDALFLIISPEGTRKKADRWKTGFYHIAIEAGVPIVLGYLDYEKKQGGLGHLFYPTGDIENDFAQIRAFYNGRIGKNASGFGEVTLLPDAKEPAQERIKHDGAPEHVAGVSAAPAA